MTSRIYDASPEGIRAIKDLWDEVAIIRAAKRCGLSWAPQSGDWFVAWSPRNGNTNAEGPWNHWATLAALILSNPLTAKSAPGLYRPDLKPAEVHTENPNPLTDQEIAEAFVVKEVGG